MESKKTRESSLTDFNIKEMIESTRRRSLVFSLLVVSVDCEQSDKRQLPFLHQYKLVSQRQITELQFLDQAFCVSNLEIVLVRTCFVEELGLRVPSESFHRLIAATIFCTTITASFLILIPPFRSF